MHLQSITNVYTQTEELKIKSLFLAAKGTKLEKKGTQKAHAITSLTRSAFITLKSKIALQ